VARPEPNFVTFEIDGRDVEAPEGAMLVDGAKYGDVEIPYFCYEPKLGKPVGACRMCLVEIEGIPKLQTACSTPVKDGMVVVTQSDRVKQAQNAVVEFLLINHPLDCPVCDKGGECPLQDISYGWGPGRSRYVEPKRHFKKPVEISPLVAIDRERCILCYRCVRFSQEIAEDYQLVFLDRADHTFVGTHDGHPYVAPFSGNIVELCPVGALTSTAYRFRARPWDIEGAGTVCTLCPSQCNVELTVRDDAKVMRVLARDNIEVDDGWLCDKGRFGYQAFHASDRVLEPMVREGGALRPASWDRALSEAVAGLRRAGERTAAIVGGEATNEEGYLLQMLLRERLGSPHLDCRRSGRVDAELARSLARPELAARTSDMEYAGAILILDAELVEESPILDLRVRKGRRRNSVKVVVATSRPSSQDAEADAVVRFAPGAGEAVACALAAALSDGARAGRDLDDLAERAGMRADALGAAAAVLRDAGPVVTLWGERLSHGERGAHGLRALLALARALGAEDEGAGLIEVPAGTNARGLREVGCLPTLGPGLSDLAADGAEAARGGLSAAEIAPALAGGELQALILFQAEPQATHPDRAAWEAALATAGLVVAFTDFVDGALAAHADVVFPAEAYAEKEGTITHPDGRLQRLRQAIAHPGQVQPQAAVLVNLIDSLGDDSTGFETEGAVSERIFAAVPFYAGLTLEEIGGQGVRWQDRDAAARLEAPEPPAEAPETPPELPEPGAGFRLGIAPSLWAGREGRHAEVLRFLAPRQRAELAAEDARRLGVAPGEEVLISVDGRRVRAPAALRDGVQPGTVFLVEGTEEEQAELLTNGLPRRVEVRRA
jgi:NADH-quinone oxidoreductase subunit G